MSEELYFREQAAEVVYQLLRDFRQRSGFDSLWDSLPEVMQKEIVDDWNDITLKVLMKDA